MPVSVGIRLYMMSGYSQPKNSSVYGPNCKNSRLNLKNILEKIR